MKKKVIIIGAITLVLVGAITLIRSTLAVDNSDDIETYNIVLNNENNTTVTVPANSTKTIIYKIHNDNNGTVKYGVGYNSNTSITVAYYKDSEDIINGKINKNEYKFIKLRLVNNTLIDDSITLSTILGYEHGGDLIAPENVSFVIDFYPMSFADKIIALYNSSPKMPDKVANLYNYANIYDVDDNPNTFGGLMNDETPTIGNFSGSNIRYYGKNPSNYVYFNCDDYANQTSSTCELWRIIGVFDGKVKIIRDESIGNFSWDNKDTTTGAEADYGKNDWTTARLMKLLNPSDYYTIDPNDNGYGQSLYWNSEKGTCFLGKYNATITDGCDFTTKGIKNIATKRKIAEVTWSLGGYYTGNYVNSAYKEERETRRFNDTRPTSWLGKIALMYPSDYGFATDFTGCNAEITYYYNQSFCRENDWLYYITNSSSGALSYRNVSEFLLTPNSKTSYSISTLNGSVVTFYSAIAKYEVRPTLFLDENEAIIGGTGLWNDPYKLGA